MLDMQEVERINRKYKFKIKQVRDDLILINTGGLDEWLIEVEPRSIKNKQHIVLKHKNNRNNTNHYHIQRRFYDYSWALGHIANHDKKYIIGYNNNKLKNSLTIA